MTGGDRGGGCETACAVLTATPCAGALQALSPDGTLLVSSSADCTVPHTHARACAQTHALLPSDPSPSGAPNRVQGLGLACASIGLQFGASCYRYGYELPYADHRSDLSFRAPQAVWPLARCPEAFFSGPAVASIRIARVHPHVQGSSQRARTDLAGGHRRRRRFVLQRQACRRAASFRSRSCRCECLRSIHYCSHRRQRMRTQPQAASPAAPISVSASRRRSQWGRGRARLTADGSEYSRRCM